MNVKKFTILHSNDMHGDFLAELCEGKKEMIGGLALLSGYIKKVRREEENVLYVISGDMVQGSLIDAEYKGVSTMEIMNYLSPDVVALGNHEFDYGLPHLLFLEKVATFPIVNANLYIKKYNRRLMQPYVILNKAGFDILFTGIITEKVLDAIKKDPLVGSFISLEEASREIGIITDAYKNDDIDLTVVLTHIGFESDLELAAMLDPEWGVDMIIGGHSHTILEQPAEVNGILIAQAGVGTDQIGRFDIMVDDDTNSIVDYTWELVPIKEGIAEPDTYMEEFIAGYKEEVDRKYSVIISKFNDTMTHSCREIETPLGNLFADILAETAGCDVMLVGSGSIRGKELGPVVTLQDFRSIFPYEDYLKRFTINGRQLKQIFAHIMRPENRNGEGECYQVNKNIRAIYNDNEKSLVSLNCAGEPVVDDELYTVGLVGYHVMNSANNLGITLKDLSANGCARKIATSVVDVVEEYLKNHQNLGCRVEGRLVYCRE
jgi:5'-nucleotidase/UDP-sugar diphosphatase